MDLTQQPLVSVLMTSYNRQQFIQEAIESVLNSSYKNFELIIVDDGSKDNTVNIARKYAAIDNRIQVHINEKNLGDYPNRNRAVSLAKGKYVMFCDSDDYFFDDTIHYCVNAMESFPQSKIGLYYAGGGDKPFTMDRHTLIQKHFFETPVLTIGPGGSIIDRDFINSIGRYPIKYGPANDMYFDLKVACETTVLLLPKLFLHYRIHEGQEKNNEYSYIHNNYRYLSDAINELNLGLNKDEIHFLKRKNDRRFSINIFQYLLKSKNFSATKQLWVKAGFNIKSLINGIFHF